jgi:hypothetical protein
MAKPGRLLIAGGVMSALISALHTMILAAPPQP